MCRKKKVDPNAKPKPKALPLHHLTRYMSAGTKCKAYTGFIFSIVSGAIMPLMSIIMGEGLRVYDPHATPEQIHESLINLLIFAAILIAATWITCYLGYAFTKVAA